MLMVVLEKPRVRFYDVSSRAEVNIGEIILQGLSLGLVVVFKRRGDVYHVVTAYPVRDMRGEAERKVKIRKWIPI